MSLSQSEPSPQVPMTLKPHAIQLVALQTVELYVKAKGDPSQLEGFEGDASLEAAHSAYNESEKTIQVRLRGGIPDSDSVPLTLSVEVVGVFKVDESRFKKEQVIKWAQINAPLVLYPYVREHVFALSVRVGARGLIMPLLEVPTFKVAVEK